MPGRTVNVATTEGRMPLYDARPDGQPRGGVVVIQEAFGVTEHIADVAERFAAEGYRAVAPHLFYRTGAPVLDYDDRDAIWPHMQSLTMPGLLDDLDATVGFLDDAGLDAGRVGAVGFCMGGSVTFLAAAKRRLGAAVSFYGGGVKEGRFGMPPLVDMGAELQTPWLGLFGDEDPSIPVADVEELRERVAKAGVPTEVVRYPGAGHGFHCDARPAAYHEAAAKDGWARTLDWFGRYLGAA